MSGWGTIYNNTRLALNAHSQQMARLQEQVASGARISRASDAPSDAYRLLKLRAQSQSLGEYTDNLDDVTRTLELAHSIVQEISQNLQTVVGKVGQAATGTYGADTRAIIGEEVNSILEQVVALANTQSLGRYLFAGSQCAAAPYVTETDGDYITEVRYQGSADDLPVPIAPGIEMSGVLVADEVFRNDDRGEVELLGETGAAAGAGTPSVRGNVYLELTHKETTILADPDASGLAVSGDADVTDTALGVYDLIVDVPGKTIRFAGGPTTSFVGTETALEVRNADGDAVYVDVTGLNGGLVAPATVTLRSDAYLSIDPDAAPTELTDFTNDHVAVVDSDGRVLYVDATGIRRTGLEPVRLPGTHDVFGMLINARDVLLNRRELSDADQIDLIRKTQQAVEEVVVGVTRAMTSLGARLGALDTLKGSITNIRATADDQAASIENADIAQIAVELARAQTLYEMTLATASRLLSLTLLDFLR